MSDTGTHASPYGRAAVALRGLPFMAFPSSAVQLFPACSSFTTLRVYDDFTSIVHLELGTKVMLARRFPFTWSLGWMEPTSLEPSAETKKVERAVPPCALMSTAL
jgi:hypothetical protein